MNIYLKQVQLLEIPASIMCFPTWNASLSHAVFQLFTWLDFFAPHMTSSLPSALWPFHYFHSTAISSLHDKPNVTHQWNSCVAVWPKRSVVSYAHPLIKQKNFYLYFVSPSIFHKKLRNATSGRFQAILQGGCNTAVVIFRSPEEFQVLMSCVKNEVLLQIPFWYSSFQLKYCLNFSTTRTLK